MIPNTIHYTSLGSSEEIGRDDVLTACTESVVDLHPGWAFVEHTDATVAELFDHPTVAALGIDFAGFFARIGNEYSGRHSRKAIQGDLIKVLSVYAHGGFALDLDMYAVQPLDRFRSDGLVLGAIREGLVSEAIIGAGAGDERLAYVLRRYVQTQNPASAVCFMHLSDRCNELGVTPYAPEYFIPHNRVDDGELLYAHTKNTHTIHLWKRHYYDRERLEAIGVELRWDAAALESCPTEEPADVKPK